MDSKSYLELSVELPRLQEDLWSAFCFEENALGIEIVNELETRLQMRVFFENQDIRLVKKLPQQFCQFYQQPLGTIQLLALERYPYEDWQSAWKQYFLPTNVGQSFTICPPWKIAGHSAERIPIVIDPGQGFGTGHHPSTRLALEALEQHILQAETIPVSMVDIGIGSGILSFAAAHLGVPLVHGVDLEKEAIQDVMKNRKLNSLEQVVQAVVGKPNCLQTQYAIVISNMLFQELLSVKTDLAHLVAPTGVLICSGFLEQQWPALKTDFQELGMAPLYLFQKEEWRAVILTHTPTP